MSHSFSILKTTIDQVHIIVLGTIKQLRSTPDTPDLRIWSQEEQLDRICYLEGKSSPMFRKLFLDALKTIASYYLY